ncbi:MAG TPA: hypothetical protein VFQ57_08005 [Sphingomonas sp.]|jgi:hypothetical protein|nr:hypothetical protein [Sphingomonas sp.]
MIRALAAAALLPLAAAASDPLAGRVAGAPQRCIDNRIADGPNIVDGQTILYRRGAIVWRTSPVGYCPSLRPFTTLIVEQFGGQTCRNDRFRTIDPTMRIPSAYCRFGDFVPYRKVKARTG